MARATANSPTRGERTRAAILGSATHRFRQHGFERTTVTEIAGDAGVSEATVFSHYGSKQGLLHEVLKTYFESLRAELEQVARGKGSAADRLRAAVRLWFERMASDGMVLQLFSRYVRFEADTAVIHDFREIGRGISGHFIGVVEDLKALGYLRPDLPASLVRDMIWGTSEQAALSAAFGSSKRDLHASADLLVDMILSGGGAASGSRTSLGSLDKKLDQILDLLEPSTNDVER